MRVLLADDHRLMRDGLRAILERDGIEVVGEVGNGLELIAQARRSRPDAVILDLAIPLLDGLEATRRLMAEFPETKVIALSVDVEQPPTAVVFAAGAVAYLPKRAASKELLIALRVACPGEADLA